MYGILLLHLSTSLGCFCPRTFLSNNRLVMLPHFGYIYQTRDNQQECSKLSNWSSFRCLLLHPYDDVIKWNHFLRYWPFVRIFHRSPEDSPHKGQWRKALMFSLICAWTSISAKNRDTGDVRRHCAHYNCNMNSGPLLGLWFQIILACKFGIIQDFSTNFMRLFMFLYITQDLSFFLLK